jgi:hypothetical protein
MLLLEVEFSDFFYANQSLARQTIVTNKIRLN